jgi:hypothetical protein
MRLMSELNNLLEGYPLRHKIMLHPSPQLRMHRTQQFVLCAEMNDIARVPAKGLSATLVVAIAFQRMRRGGVLHAVLAGLAALSLLLQSYWNRGLILADLAG